MPSKKGTPKKKRAKVKDLTMAPGQAGKVKAGSILGSYPSMVSGSALDNVKRNPDQQAATPIPIPSPRTRG